MQVLISQLQVENTCTINELALADDNLAICADLSDDQREENFLAEIGPSSSKSTRTEDIGDSSDVESESDEESTDLPPTSVRFRNLHEAITCLEDVHHFLEHKGHTSEATETMSLISSLTTLHSVNLSKARQASLLEFFAGTS